MTARSESRVFAAQATFTPFRPSPPRSGGRMRHLFFKVFVWFWLTVILAGAALAGTVLYALQRSHGGRRLWIEQRLPETAKRAAETFEKMGNTGLSGYLKFFGHESLESGYPIEGFVFRK